METSSKVLLTVGAILIIGSFALPTFSNVNERTPTDLARQRIAHLGMALRFYADDHRGDFPDQLSELDADDSPQTDQIHFYQTRTKTREWLYFPGHTISDPPGTILAACPVTTAIENKRPWPANLWPVDQKRVIWTVGVTWTVEGSCDAIPESEFQQRIKTQSKGK